MFFFVNTEKIFAYFLPFSFKKSDISHFYS